MAAANYGDFLTTTFDNWMRSSSNWRGSAWGGMVKARVKNTQRRRQRQCWIP